MARKRKFDLPPLDMGAETIGNRITHFRKLNGLNQKELAAKIGITHYLVSDYETGRLHLNDDMIVRFALALNTSADKLLGIEGAFIKEEHPVDLRIMKRVREIETLSASKQKALFQIIDGFLKGEKTSESQK